MLSSLICCNISPDCRNPDGNRAVCPRDATQMFETDSPSALSGTKNDGQYVTLRTHIDSCLFASNFLLMEVYLNGILAHELKNHILLTALTWYLAGISGYLLVAWICLEPAWKRRILNLIIAVLLLRIFFLSPTPEAYNKFLPYLVVYTLLTASFSWLSIVRFKAGKQD